MLKNDIKHTYYGRPMSLEYRAGSEYPTLEQIRRSQEDRALKQRILRGKTTTYRNYTIPAAPAFRVLSRYDVDTIIDRVRKPTVASNGSSESADERCMADRRRSAPKYMGLRRIETAEQVDITERLSAPTHTSKLRAEKDPIRQATVINKIIPSDSLLLKSRAQLS